MNPPNFFIRFLDWLDKNFYYNCEKGRHHWGYFLSEVGKVYDNEEDVPLDAWFCKRCSIHKQSFDNQVATK